ncbi:MAG: 4-hydroxy-tetrahydrodipicolinate reductase [Chitinophagaceae bacterium]|nr:4-hydroxy-tetrahydrodipicolinate reductase [Chitinophagaceae bacterium]
MKVALIGYGNMGKTIQEVAEEKGHDIVCIITQKNKDEFTPENLHRAEVALEFTGPHSAYEHLVRCIEWQIPVVCGSTGWTDRLDEIKKMCIEKEGSVVFSSNFSIGVNIFFELNKKLASLMAHHQEYEVSLREIHHIRKKDAPSGTAITLAEQIMSLLPHKKKWVSHTEASSDEIPVESIRVGDVPGTHHVIYHSSIDTLEMIHTAHNRKGFATGAVLAAEFIKDKKGFFTMKDVLNL